LTRLSADIIATAADDPNQTTASLHLPQAGGSMFVASSLHGLSLGEASFTVQDLSTRTIEPDYAVRGRCHIQDSGTRGSSTDRRRMSGAGALYPLVSRNGCLTWRAP